MTALARKITLARVEAGLTQAELSEAAGVSPSAISLYERGLSRPRPKPLAAIAKATGRDIAWFAEDWAGGEGLSDRVDAIQQRLEMLENEDAQGGDLEPGVRDLLRDSAMMRIHELSGDEIKFLKALRAGGYVQTPQQALMMVLALRTSS